MKRRSHVLQQLLRGFVQRRSHEVLVEDLPDKSEHIFCIRLSAIQERLYLAVCCQAQFMSLYQPDFRRW